ETSSRNSEVIHAGIYYPTGSLKARLCVAGKLFLYRYCEGRGVPYERCGKLIVATDPEQNALLEGIRRRAAENGVGDLEFWPAERAKELEPALQCTAALWSPSTGIIDSHRLMLAFEGDAEDHGAMIAFDSPLLAAKAGEDGIELQVGGAEPIRLLARVLVNSAGVTARMRADEVEAGQLQRLMAVNVIGLMLCCREAIRRMSTRLGGPGGAIVNVSSMAAAQGGRPGASHYAGSKGAVDSYTKGVAREVAAEGIRINAVRPGVTLTDMVQAVRDDPKVRAAIDATIPMSRPAAASEIAAPIVWLLSVEASFVTGAIIDASGGGFVIGASTG
ncbi:MAG: SDR family oxidoreductase, partial [Rhizobiales bacterium]|nr:SDR family oxidoreductase [Hyphomicrobiales bacterium]